MGGLIILGTFVDTPTRDAIRIRESYLCVVSLDTGKIVTLECLPSTDWNVFSDDDVFKLAGKEFEGYKVLRLRKSQFVCPGFVDCHCHAPQYKQIGTATDYTIFNWLNEVTFPNEAKCADLDYARSLYMKLVQRLLRNGTTCVQYFATNHVPASKLLADICENMGQRAFVGKVCADQNSRDYYVETTQESYEGTEEFINYVHGMKSGRDAKGKDALVNPVVTPRFVPTCSDALLTKLGELAKKHDVRVQSHASETVDQVLRVRKLHPDIGGGRDTAIFKHFGLLTDKTLFAHGTHLRDAEVDEIVRAGASVSSCPIANLMHSQAVLPVKRFHDRGLKIGLGTDIAGGYFASMLGPIRNAVIQNRTEEFVAVDREGEGWPTAGVKWPVDFKYAFHVATVGGAEALGIQDLVGTLDIGKSFDALIVDADRPDQAFDYWAEDGARFGFEKWVNMGDDRNVVSTFVNGRLVASRP
ncbi:Metallo-dependent hydrolase [Neolentinus lepideus HHB14362 ss-1]|uniref:Metallo-dependent hydrolase n=1 Tax=Neolentinus lepideus HHB14362 ss-1 TaxID=1314782 RepID=A0A165NBC1_9AGAM|nr:Metallo-dependent hydrolase [Neolentinus lepideus HHB14362 ss-1]